MRIPKTWREIFMNMAREIAQRSKDPSSQVGAILTDVNNVIISAGFNGPPASMPDSVCPWNERPEKYDYIVHAEANAIDYGVAARGLHGLSGARLYVTHYPCKPCLLRCKRFGISTIVSAGIKWDGMLGMHDYDIFLNRLGLTVEVTSDEIVKGNSVTRSVPSIVKDNPKVE